MRLFIGHTTALLLWRSIGEGRLPMPAPSEICSLSGCVTGVRQARRIDLSPLGLSLCRQGLMRDPQCDDDQGMRLAPGKALPLDVLVPSASQMHATQGIRPHMLAGPLPQPAFHLLAEDILIASPPLCLAQNLDRCRDLPNLELVMELCGEYACEPDGGMRTRRRPITTVGQLRDAAEAMRGGKGAHVLRRSLAHVVDGSCSPRETETFLMLTLPPRLGGYGLPKPQINQPVNIGGRASRFTSDEWYVADFLYARERVIVEYDGRAYHQQRESLARDKNRRSVLAAMGFAVIVISAEDVANVYLFDQKAEQIAALLRRPLTMPDDEQLMRRHALFQWLFNPRHQHLPLGFGY